jgi:hypothetical protein
MAIPPSRRDRFEKLLATLPAIQSKGAVEAFPEKYKTKLFESYGVDKEGWATVPDELLKNRKELAEISHEYAKTVRPKYASELFLWGGQFCRQPTFRATLPAAVPPE